MTPGVTFTNEITLTLPGQEKQSRGPRAGFFGLQTLGANLGQSDGKGPFDIFVNPFNANTLHLKVRRAGGIDYGRIRWNQLV